MLMIAVAVQKNRSKNLKCENRSKEVSCKVECLDSRGNAHFGSADREIAAGKEKERRMTDQELHINALHAAFIPLSREESRRKKQPELEGGSVNKFVEVVYMHLTVPSGLKEIVTGICLVA